MWRPIAALALIAGLAAPVWQADGVSAQEELPATAAAAPESAVVFHSLDLDLEGTQWQLTEELLGRVGVSDALDLWEEAILEEGAASGDFTEADLNALLGGEMAIVVTPLAVERGIEMHMAGHGGEVAADAADATPSAQTGDRGYGVAALLVPGDADAAWEYVEKQLTDLAAELDVELNEDAYGEAELLIVSPGDLPATPEADSDDPMEEWLGEFDLHRGASLVAGRAGDYIIVGRHEADVTGVVDVIDGNAASLADSAEAEAVAAELPGEALSFTYIDGQGILDTLGPELTAMLQSYAPEMPEEAWGGQFGLTISADDPGFRFDTISILSAEGGADVVLVENDPAVASAAEQAPAGTFLFQAGTLPETAYAGAPYALAQAVNDAVSGGERAGEHAKMDLPTPEEMEEEIETATATLGFDPAADLFDLLGYGFIAFSSFPAITFDSFDLDAVAAVSTTDPTALAGTAEKIAALIDRSGVGVEVSTRSVDGDTVYAVSVPEMGDVQALEFGVVADQLIVAIGEGIEQLTMEPDESLADDPQFQTVMALLPDEYYQVSYVDTAQAIRVITALMGAMGEMGRTEGAATPTAGASDLENIRALGAVAFQRDGMAGASAILYIAEPSS